MNAEWKATYRILKPKRLKPPTVIILVVIHHRIPPRKHLHTNPSQQHSPNKTTLPNSPVPASDQRTQNQTPNSPAQSTSNGPSPPRSPSAKTGSNTCVRQPSACPHPAHRFRCLGDGWSAVSPQSHDDGAQARKRTSDDDDDEAGAEIHGVGSSTTRPQPPGEEEKKRKEEKKKREEERK